MPLIDDDNDFERGSDEIASEHSGCQNKPVHH